MMKKEENDRIIDSYDYLANAASAMDCTGLIPAGEGREEQLEAYQELYRFGAYGIACCPQKKKNEEYGREGKEEPPADEQKIM